MENQRNKRTLLTYPTDWKKTDPNLTLMLLTDVKIEEANKSPDYINNNNFKNFIEGEDIDEDVILETGEMVITMSSEEVGVYFIYEGEIKNLYLSTYCYETLRMIAATIDLKDYIKGKFDEVYGEEDEEILYGNIITYKDENNRIMYINEEKLIN